MTTEFMQALSISPPSAAGPSPLLDRLTIPVLLGVGVAITGFQVLNGHWIQVGVYAISIILVLALALSPRLQTAALGMRFNREHAFYILLAWLYGVGWFSLTRLMWARPAHGKESTAFYILLLAIIFFSVMIGRTLMALSARYHTLIAVRVPIWEQWVIALNELLAAGLCALFFGSWLAHVLQPGVFTLWHDPFYTAAVGAALALYYVAIQLMWVQRYNDALSRTEVWLRYARVVSPLALLVVILLIARRIVERSDLRSATLLTSATTNLAILAIAPVILVMIAVFMYLIFTSSRGIRQRFLPDLLLDRLPVRVAALLRSISDMDIVLIVMLLAVSVPAYVVMSGGTALAALREQILVSGGALLETDEQVLALLVAFPIYLLILAVLILYATVIARSSLSASERNELTSRLPIGFLIAIIITLYLFAVPFSQALIEGRLPRLQQDLGRILLFSILLPLILLYGHYFVLVRLPYERGQRRWRELQNAQLTRQLEQVEGRIDTLNQEIERLDRRWLDHRRESEPASRFDTLYRYVQLNGMRDDLNMQRLRVLSERQELSELSDAPVSIAVARLPLRIVSVGIPLLLAVQLYQWAMLNNGLREILNNPNLTVVDFFREILSQLNF